jgi:hypothetical protein
VRNKSTQGAAGVTRSDIFANAKVILPRSDIFANAKVILLRSDIFANAKVILLRSDIFANAKVILPRSDIVRFAHSDMICASRPAGHITLLAYHLP